MPSLSPAVGHSVGVCEDFLSLAVGHIAGVCEEQAHFLMLLLLCSFF